MSSRNRNRQICIALVVFLASCLFACAKAYHDERRKEFIPVLQFVATVALFFGILKAPREHESVFLLFWLVCTLIFWLVLLFCGCDLVIYNRVSIRRDDTITLFVVVAISSVMVPYLEYLMYNMYVELTQTKLRSLEHNLNST